jgi:hypothetical protein
MWAHMEHSLLGISKLSGHWVLGLRCLYLSVYVLYSKYELFSSDISNQKRIAHAHSALVNITDSKTYF